MNFMTFVSLALIFWQESPGISSPGLFDILWLLLQTVFALAVVCGLAILIFRYILPKLNVVSFDKSIVRVVDGTSIDARKRLIVVETAGKYLLLGVSENGINLVSELDGAAVEQAVADADKTKKNPKKDSFSEVIGRFWQK